MFTCQGDWGLVELPSDVSPSPCLERFCEQLKALPAAQAIWKRVQAEAARWNVVIGSAEYTVCLELCKDTWVAQQEVRLHAHCAFMAPSRMDLQFGDDANERFLGTSVQISAELGTRRRSTGWTSFLYCQAPKIGSLRVWQQVCFF